MLDTHRKMTALGVYQHALAYMHESGRSVELDWQRDSVFGAFTETDFLRETAWVILCSGFRETAVRRVFDYVSLAFCDWESAGSIAASAAHCKAAALEAFRSKAKIGAIVETALAVDQIGFDYVRQRVLTDPIVELQAFPFIGPITAFHLAKNLGFDTAKPDRHLVRLAQVLDYPDAHRLCSDLSQMTGESSKVVDLVLWRYLADHLPRSSVEMLVAA